ncbi:MAG TPA: TIGR04104 family putative zinc finger protein [Sporosarcina sp.]|nr:TIGR04104 family putative zinc finger protein [Sporosarcina sp.]
MNNLKNTLAKQLETIGLSEERKKIIAEKAKKQQASSHKKGQWAYRVILSVVALLAVSFTYLLLKNDSFQLSANSAATEETNIQTLLMNSDGVKIGILAVVFMITYSMLAWRKRLNYWVLPHCIYCQEDWTYRQSLKRIWGSYKTTCPHCGEVQYQTKATMRRMDYFNLSLPLIIVIALLFNNVWLGASVYILSILFMMSRFGPYLMTFQHEKASLNRLLKFVQVAIIMLVVTSTLIMADETYDEPNEAVFAKFGKVELIPGYVINDKGLFFVFEQDHLIGYVTVRESLFGWKIDEDHTEIGTLSIKEIEQFSVSVMYDDSMAVGLFKQENAVLLVDGQIAQNYPLAGNEEFQEVEDVFLWWHERDDDEKTITLQLLDDETGEVLEQLEI